MARARNIKPSFFSNDELAEIEPLGRLLFIGLWTIADFKGEFEYRPKKLKAQLLPYDNCDIKKIMINLDLSRFITFYADNNKIYAKINNFEKHQNPHPNEKKKGSEIPVYSEKGRQLIDLKEVTINHDKTRQVIDDSITDPADSLILIPDSCSLIPDSLQSESMPSSKTLVELKPDEPDDAKQVFEFWQTNLNHPRSAYDSKRKALIKKSLKNYSKEDLMKAIHGCSMTPFNMGENDSGAVFDKLSLIFKDADQIDRFITNSDNPPTGKNKTIEQLQGENSVRAERIMKSMGMNANA